MKGTIDHVAIAMMIFPHVKITCFHTKAHLLFNWCLCIIKTIFMFSLFHCHPSKGLHVLQTNLDLHPVGLLAHLVRALHQYHRGQGFKSRTSLNFFRLSFWTTKVASIHYYGFLSLNSSPLSSYIWFSYIYHFNWHITNSQQSPLRTIRTNMLHRICENSIQILNFLNVIYNKLCN